LSSARRRLDPGVLIIGGDFQGLGIARSLGEFGVPVCVVDDEPSVSRYSRHVDHAVRVDDLRDEQNAVAALLDTGRRLGLDGWVLFPTRDETVEACSRNREALQERFRVPVQSWDTIRWAADKRLTYQLAVELGVPVPRVRARAEGAPGTADYPLVVKPAFKAPFIYSTGVKAWRVGNAGELRDRTDRAAAAVPADQVILQDYVPGDGRQQFAFCALVRDGEPVATMTVNRRRQHPIEFGRASTFVRTVEMPELEQLATRMLRAMRYDGLVEVEFKVDPRDGEPKLLDINTRSWGYHALGRRAGVDFPTLLFRQALGETVEPARAEPGVGWIRLLTDLPTSAIEMWRGELGVSAFVRSVRDAQAESVFSWRDPMPALAEVALVPHLVRSRGASLSDAA
jgi:D-aspartate ligase